MNYPHRSVQYLPVVNPQRVLIRQPTPKSPNQIKSVPPLGFPVFRLPKFQAILYGDSSRTKRRTRPFGLQSYLLKRWDWGGCQEGPVIPSEEVRLEV